MNRKPSMEVSLTKMWKPFKYRYEKIAMVLDEKTVLVRLQNYILEATKVHLKRDDKNNLAYGSSFFSVFYCEVSVCIFPTSAYESRSIDTNLIACV